MPGKGAPWRFHDRVAFRVFGSGRCIDLDCEQLANEVDVTDAERPRDRIASYRPQSGELPAHGCRRGIDVGIVVTVARVVLRAPAIGEYVSVKEIRDAGLGAVMEGGAEHAVGQFQLCEFVWTD